MNDDRLTRVEERSLAEEVLFAGSERAFRELYRHHTPRLYQTVLRLVGGVENDAEDVVQETWIRAVAGLEGFRWEARFRTWLTGIALNVCRARWRKRKGREIIGPETADIPVQPPDPDAHIDLERALALLPPGYRVVLVLHDLEGFTHAEIGERLGISSGTSKSQLFRARRTVRRLLSPEDEDEPRQEMNR